MDIILVINIAKVNYFNQITFNNYNNLRILTSLLENKFFECFLECGTYCQTCWNSLVCK